jgi:hypothetical protein
LLKTGNPITIRAFHANAALTVSITLEANPRSPSQFVQVTETSVLRMGDLSVPFSLDKLNSTQLRQLGVSSSNDLVGKSGTIMTIFDAGDGVLYQCADIAFAAAGTATPKSKGSTLGDPLRVSIALSLLMMVMAGIML